MNQWCYGNLIVNIIIIIIIAGSIKYYGMLLPTRRMRDCWQLV